MDIRIAKSNLSDQDVVFGIIPALYFLKKTIFHDEKLKEMFIKEYGKYSYDYINCGIQDHKI